MRVHPLLRFAVDFANLKTNSSSAIADFVAKRDNPYHIQEFIDVDYEQIKNYLRYTNLLLSTFNDPKPKAQIQRLQRCFTHCMNRVIYHGNSKLHPREKDWLDGILGYSSPTWIETQTDVAPVGMYFPWSLIQGLKKSLGGDEGYIRQCRFERCGLWFVTTRKDTQFHKSSCRIQVSKRKTR